MWAAFRTALGFTSPSEEEEDLTMYGVNAALKACYRADLDQVKQALVLNGCNELQVRSADGYSCFHLSVASDDAKVVVLLCKEASLIHLAGQPDKRGFSPLMMATSRGHVEIAQLLLPHSDLSLQAKDGKTLLHFAIRYPRILRLILENCDKCLVDVADAEGFTSLHACAMLSDDADIIELLASRSSDLNARNKQRQTPLILAAQSGHLNAVICLLRFGADATLDGSFGATALHRAVENGHESCVAILTAADSNLSHCRDDDGLSPAHYISTAISKGISISPKIVDLLSNALNETDYASCSPLVKLCFHLNGSEPRAIAERMLELGADPCLEYDHGWNAMHVVQNLYSDEVHLLALMQRIADERGYVFDAAKPRVVDNSNFWRLRGSWNRIPEEIRDSVLCGDNSLHGIASLIRSGKCQNIVIMSGAGISTAVGIADYRSKDSGVYSSEATRGIFDGAQFYKDPSVLYKGCKRLFEPLFVKDGSVSVSLAHRFFALLERKKLLLRVYDQNIDGLTVKSVANPDRVRQCHGSLETSRCIKCHQSAGSSFLDGVRLGQVSECVYCDGFIRPDVCFFGEPLTEDFLKSQFEDLSQKADLIIVMGTSLKVYPFASLPSLVSSLTPRLLINNEKVGSFTEEFRDVLAIGDIDQQIAQLISLLGWESDLAEIPKTVSSLK